MIRLAPLHADEGEERFTVADPHAYEEGGQKAAPVDQADHERKLRVRIHFIRRFEQDLNAGNICLSEEAGYAEKTQEGSRNKIDEIVPGIDRGHAQEDGYGNIQPAGAGDPNYAGTAIWSMSDRMISFLSRASDSSLKITRCGMT